MDNKVIQMVKDFYIDRVTCEFDPNDLDIYIVWKCKTLQNCKYLLSSNAPDTRYFEITYNGNTKEFYVDVYTKELNICIKA